MSNANTFGGLLNLSQTNPTSETAFGSPAGTPTVRSLASIKADALLGSFDGRAFRIRGVWVVTGGTTTNITLKVYLNAGGNTNATTFTNDVALSSSGAIAVNSVTRPIMMDHIVLWDGVSQTLNGSFNIQSSNTYTAYAALSNQGTAVVGQVNLQFFATALFSASNAGNIVTMKELALEAL